jgi:hypothetical protein
MKYFAYDTFVDYLFSQESDQTTYGDLRAFLTSAGSFDTFQPTRSDGSIETDQISELFIPSSSFAYPSSRMDCRPRVSDSNGLYSETDGTYEEVFNIPASANLDRSSSYVQKFVQKAIWNAELLGQTSGEGKAEILSNEIPFKTEFSEEEYDAYGISLTFLNGGAPGVVADTIACSGSSMTVASGCLIAVQKERQSDGADCLFPIGFIDFEKLVPSTRYEVEFDPMGFIQLS